MNLANCEKVRLPHGEWLWVERTKGAPGESGEGILRNQPIVPCGLSWGDVVRFTPRHQLIGCKSLSWLELDVSVTHETKEPSQ